MATAPPKALALKLLRQLDDDRQNFLLKLDRYVAGDQDRPYVPRHALQEYKDLADKCITNVCAFVSEVPTQGMYVDSFRRGSDSSESSTDRVTARTRAVQPEWDHWQRSRMDTRQHSIYRSALNFGHAFVATERNAKGVVLSRGLSPLRTTAVFADPANDEDPLAALEVVEFPYMEGDKWVAGWARMWDGATKYEITFESFRDAKKMAMKAIGKHGSAVCPVTRFAAAVDLEGRTVGVVEPLLVLQDRLNQGVFDLLVTSTYSSFKVRWATGMAPPIEMVPVLDSTGAVIGQEPKLDDAGNPIPKAVNVSQARFLHAEDVDTKFGTLDETPLDGFIESIKMSFQHIAALSQTPPHHLLGQIANLSADALVAAESALARKVAEFQASFGESWERVFRLASALADDPIGENDYSGEVVWRDMNNENLAQVADGLGKIAESLGIPKRGLWSRVPNVTAQEMAIWETMLEEDNTDAQMADALQRGAVGQRPTYRPEDQPTEPVVA